MDSRITTGQYRTATTFRAARHEFHDAVGADDHQRQHDRADQQGDEVEQERQQPGGDDAALAVEAVHDGDGVDEDVHRAGSGPQGDARSRAR